MKAVRSYEGQINPQIQVGEEVQIAGQNLVVVERRELSRRDVYGNVADLAFRRVKGKRILCGGVKENGLAWFVD